MKNSGDIKQKTGYHHGDLRAQLVEATRVLVEEKGPDHFSVSEAARIAGVSTAAPYRHFSDKDAMLLAVADKGGERHLMQMQSEVSKFPKGSIDRIIAMGSVYVNFARNEPGVFRLKFSRKLAADQQMADDDVRPLDFVEREVADYLGRAEIDDDIRKRAFLLWTFVHGLSFLLIDEKTSFTDLAVDLDDVLTDIAERVMR
ncbi:MAG: TetR/AcrR family transcriptional regulator [Rhodobacteraceae bacterium]|nr:TetR/AcrR family transcriptional regulator [Paracoccaceae bacterium]